MSEQEAVRDALRQAAVDGVGKSREFSFETAMDGADKILRHIDTCVLARRLTFRFDDGESLRLEAAGRRLLQVVPPAPEGSGQRALFGKNPLGLEDLRPIADLFHVLCAGRKTMRVTSQPLKRVDPAGGAGLSVTGMREALGLKTDEPASRPFLTAIERLLEDPATNITTAVWIEGDIGHILAGDDIAGEALAAWGEQALNHLLVDEFALATALETDGAVVHGLPDARQGHALIVGRLGQFFLAQIAGQDTVGSLLRWRDAQRGTQEPDEH